MGHEKTDFQNHIYLSYRYEIKLMVLTSSVEDVTLDNHFISEHAWALHLSKPIVSFSSYHKHRREVLPSICQPSINSLS